MTDPWLELPFLQRHHSWFKSGGWRLWASQYPVLFDENDRANAVKQAARGYYFREWLSAVTLFNRHSLRSLIGQYSSAKYTHKTSTISKFVPRNVLRVLTDRSRFGGTRPPDLFVYNVDATDWFFAEVKGPGDYLRPNQIKMIEALERATGKPVRVIHLRKRRGLARRRQDRIC